MRAGGDRPWSNDGTLCGVYYAIVTQNKDEELKQARIKVRFPWMPGGDQDQAHWAQLATPMSGNKWGWYTLPEVGDVVVVVFIAGDIRQPVVLGGIWSKTDAPPEPITDGKNEVRGYKSRSGHRFLLDDSGKPKISLMDKTDMLQLSVGQTDKDGAGPNAHTIAKPDSGATSGVSMVAMSGKFKILCPDGTLKIEGQEVVISADDKIDINASAKLTCDAGSSLDMKAGQPAKFQATKIDVN
jgi:uncharacterized protein involved in type VI secretion and phage assembly